MHATPFRGVSLNKNVSALIQKEELKSEKISAFAQILFLCGMFLIYFFTPKGFTESTFEPVKILFLFYTPLLLVRLFLALRELLGGALLYLFLTLDIAALTILIWSFHVQYQSPFTLTLRAPTFLFYFVFISIRCLSYDFKKVFFVCASTILFWASLVIYGISTTDILITSNFADYLKPKAVLLGIEIEKVIVLFLMGSLLSLAVFRKKKLLELFSSKAAKEGIFERLIGKKSLENFDIEKNPIRPGRGVKRSAATMMVDLRGFSKLSYQISPEELLAYLGQYQKIVAEIVFRHGGSIDKYLGDGILIHFGAVSENKSYAKAALKASEDIFDALTTWCEQTRTDKINFNFGISITVGEVIFGVIGHEERMEITTIGESVNLSAKLEKYTKELERNVLTTKKAFEMAREQGFIPRLAVTEFQQSIVPGIPHSLDVIGFSGHKRQ